jgi:sortase A
VSGRPRPLARRYPRWLRPAAALLAASGLVFLAAGLWIPVKAELARHLMERSWRLALAGEPAPPPWPWADTWPVARLTLPGGESTVVLSGTSGHALAFAPGHVLGTAAPGAPGNAVVAGHRDTHFRALRGLAPGDPIEVETRDGRRVVYRVTGARVVRETDTGVLRDHGSTELTLLTCYPFGAVTPGPLRYVVRAVTGDA